MADTGSESMETTTPDPAPEAQTPEPRSFSQDDVDRIVKDRLARAKTEPPADYKDLQAAAARLAEIEEANKTETQKLSDKLAAAEKQRDDTLSEAKEIRLRSAILAEAAKPDRRVIDTDAVIALIDRDSLELDDTGTPKNIAKAMDRLLEQRPFLVAQGGARGNADQGARPGAANQLGRDDLKSMSADDIVKARKEGRLTNLAGTS